jgi:hypothetical protein
MDEDEDNLDYDAFEEDDDENDDDDDQSQKRPGMYMYGGLECLFISILLEIINIIYTCKL